MSTIHGGKGGAIVNVSSAADSFSYRLYYDQQQTRVDGKRGRWCRARYNGIEGWAWGWSLVAK